MKLLSQILLISKRLGKRAIAQRANRLLCLCIVVCTCVSASLSFFANSVQLALDNDIANYLGAPFVVRSDTPIEIQHLFSDAYPQENLETLVTTASFVTGAISKHNYQSVALKGVSSNYPLQGDLLIKFDGVEQTISAQQLTRGKAWLDQRAMHELNISIGDSFQIGSAWLTVSGQIIHEPDRLTQLQHVLPRVLVNLETLDNIGVNLHNNRGEHRLLISATQDQLNTLESHLANTLTQRYDILKPAKGRHPFSRISQRAERMLNVVLVLILLMCGGAAATLADHSMRSYAMPATVLRCMGVKRRAVAWALCIQLLFLSLLMSLIGCLFAWLIQPLLINLMQPHMSLQVAPVSVGDLLGPIGIGLVTIIAFVIPKLQQLGSISVSSVLRGHIDNSKRSYSSTLLAAILVFSILWFTSDNLQLTVILVGAVCFLIVLSLTFGWTLSKLSAQAHHLFRGPLKIAIRSIGRSPSNHITSLASVSIVMMAILMGATLRGSFLDALHAHNLDSNGNYVYTNLAGEQRDQFQNTIENSGAEIRGSHPTLSARLVTINGVKTDDALKHESDTREETRSKVRLSWAKELPSNNSLVSGTWPSIGSNEVSVESEVMSDLGLSIGDQLGFQIINPAHVMAPGESTTQNGATNKNLFITATISSERKYKQGASRMMFWFMFAPDTLSSFKQQYMGGIMIESNSSNTLSKLSQEFPQVRITDLEHQISGIRDIMIVLTRLMNSTLLLLLSGALVVIIATSFVNASKKRTQLTLLRAIGLRRAQCYAMNMAEQFIIGLVACLIGILSVQLVAGLLFDSLFALPYKLEWQSALVLSGVIILSFISLACFFAFRQLKQDVKLS